MRRTSLCHWKIYTPHPILMTHPHHRDHPEQHSVWVTLVRLRHSYDPPSQIHHCYIQWQILYPALHSLRKFWNHRSVIHFIPTPLIPYCMSKISVVKLRSCECQLQCRYLHQIVQIRICHSPCQWVTTRQRMKHKSQICQHGFAERLEK